MDDLARFVKNRHEKLKATRFNWEAHWLEVTEHVIPRKRNVQDFRSQPGGEKRQSRIYDTTAIQANEILASALQGMLTNPSTQWFDLTTGIPELDNQKEVRAWLQRASRRIVQVLNNSNFQTEIHEMYIDLGSIGTATLLIEEDDDSIIRFQARPIYEHWIGEDYTGLVDTISFEPKLMSRQIKQKYNLEKAAKRLDEGDRMQLEKLNQDPLKEWNMIHYIAPRSEFEAEELLGVPKNFKFISVHVIEDMCLAVRVSGFEEFPYAVPRWTKTSSEIYGRSPAIKALPDIKMINEIMRVQIRSAQKIIDPPLQVPDDGVLLPIRTTPGGINYYRAGSQDRIVPLDTGGRIDIGEVVMDDVRRRIREAFFIDQLQLLEGPQMTATEVLQRTEEKLRLLGPVLGRLHFELLKPLIGRVIGVLGRKNQLPDNPPNILKDKDLEVQFSSMIARAQRASEADNIQRVIGLMAPVIEAQPEVLDNLDGDGLLKFVGNLFNVPNEMFKSDDAVAEIREGRAQAQQQQQQMEQENLQSQTAKNVGVTAGQ